MRELMVSERELTEPLSKEEQFKLIEKARKGDEDACARLVLSMTRWIKKIAFRYYNIRGPDLDDAIQETYLYLLHAVLEVFDLSYNVKPSTHASPWIRLAIAEHLRRNSGPMTLPRYIVLSIAKLGAYPKKEEVEEVAERTGISLETVWKVVMSQRAFSADRPILLDGEDEIWSVLEDPNQPRPEAVYLREEVRTIIREAMGETLTERERQIMELRFGIDGPPRTLQETGDVVSLSRERVRQIIKLSLKKIELWLLNHPQHRIKLQGLCN